jgi:drug/metabolite transporter (DMT)-like permease
VRSGVPLALAGYAVFAWADALIKSLGGQLSIFEVGFFNIVFASIFLLILRPAGERWRDFWRMKRPWAVNARAVLGVFSGVCSIYAFTHIPLAESYALIFMCPLLVTLLSIVLLKEQVGIWRWAAVFAGFAGVLLVVRPGVRVLELGHLAAFTAAFIAALSVILTRSLATERQTTILGMLCTYALIFNGAAAAATGFAWPSWQALGTLAVIGACVAAGNRLSLLSLRLSPANVIAPTHYSQMIWAVILGAFFFNEVPDVWTLIGLAVIAGAGLLTFARERIRLGRIRYYRLSRGRL